MADKKDNKEIQYIETPITKWGFRIGSLLSILICCYLSIRFEFNKMKQEKEHREFTQKIAVNMENSMTALQDSWETMYYFYQTGDLFKILRCPNVQSKDENVEEDVLIRLFREKYDKKINDEDMFYPSCGEQVNIIIGTKSDPYSKSQDLEQKTITIGQEPVEMIEKYTFLKYALKELKFGERATFMAIPKERTIIHTRKKRVYDLRIMMSPNIKKEKIPTYVKLSQVDNKYSIANKSHCGSVVSFFYTIKNIDESIIGKQNIAGKAKIGEYKFNKGIEKVIENTKTNESYRIFLTKNFFEENTDFIRENPKIKDKDIVIIDLMVIGVK